MIDVVLCALSLDVLQGPVFDEMDRIFADTDEAELSQRGPRFLKVVPVDRQAPTVGLEELGEQVRDARSHLLGQLAELGVSRVAKPEELRDVDVPRHRQGAANRWLQADLSLEDVEVCLEAS